MPSKARLKNRNIKEGPKNLNFGVSKAGVRGVNINIKYRRFRRILLRFLQYYFTVHSQNILGSILLSLQVKIDQVPNISWIKVFSVIVNFLLHKLFDVFDWFYEIVQIDLKGK